jgi:hypothetical protein
MYPAFPLCGECLQGERRCNFASPLSPVGSLPPVLPPLLERLLGRHNREQETKMLLPPAVRLSLGGHALFLNVGISVL